MIKLWKNNEALRALVYCFLFFFLFAAILLTLDNVYGWSLPSEGFLV